VKPPFGLVPESVMFDTSFTSFDEAERDGTGFWSFCLHKQVVLFKAHQANSRPPDRNRYLSSSIQEKFRERSLETSSFYDIIEAVNVQPMPDGVEHPNRIVPS
jgi:hypothetical protein